MLKHLQEMQPEDIKEVVAVIASQDEDDAEEAAASFSQIGGIMDMFVLRHADKIIGVTGFSTPPGCDNTYWISWTYVHEDYTNQGFGRKMLGELIDFLKAREGRMLFVKVSDYVDDEDGPLYAAALHLYQSLGFKIEITHPDYYDVGEAQIILGMRISDTPAMIANFDVPKEMIPVQFNAVYQIAETDGSYTFGWHEEGETLFTRDDVQLGIDEVRKETGRAIFLSFPSNFKGINETLVSADFKTSGLLHDYYEDGIHDEHYRYYL